MFKKINKYRCKNFHINSQKFKSIVNSVIRVSISKKKNLCDIKKELGREENQTFFLSILLYGSD